MNELCRAYRSFGDVRNIQDGDLCKKNFISIFSHFFLVFKMISSDALILPVSQLQTQQVMTSRIRSHIFNTDLLYSRAHFIVKIDENLALMTGFNTI